ARTGEPGVVRADCGRRDGAAAVGRPLVGASSTGGDAPRPGARMGAAYGPVAPACRRRAARAGGLDLLEVLLPRQPEQLLHHLFFQPLLRVAAERGGHTLTVS